MSKNAKHLTAFAGRLNWHQLTAADALEETMRGPFASPDKTAATENPYVTLVLTEGQYDVLRQRAEDYLDMTAENYAAAAKGGGKVPKSAKDTFDPKVVQAFKDQLNGEFGSLITPFKDVDERLLDMWPDAAKTVKVIGPKGGEWVQNAIVRDSSELRIPDPDLITFPTMVPIGQTHHKFYRGCHVIVDQLSFYGYFAGANPGFSLGGKLVVFSKDDAEFSGAPAANIDDVFKAAGIE